MTVKEWYETRGDSVASEEGRGEIVIEEIGNNRFGASLSDDALNQSPQNPSESDMDYKIRIEMEISRSIFNGSENIEQVVRYFADQIGFNDDDKAQIVANWKAENFGQ